MTIKVINHSQTVSQAISRRQTVLLALILFCLMGLLGLAIYWTVTCLT